MNPVPKPEPRIAQYEKMFFGIQMHWGLYSLRGQGEWIMSRKQIPASEYNKLADTFTAEDFNPRAIARLAKEAGARYITLTARHHEGFSLYDTRGLSDFDAPHSAAKRDLVAEFVEGCRAENIVPTFYHTTLDFQWDSKNCDEKKFNEYLDYLYASIEILMSNYGTIGAIRLDGNASRQDADWKEGRLYAMIRKHQPDIIIINNPGMRAPGTVSHPELDVINHEQHGLKPINREGAEKYRAATLSQTMSRHWGIGNMDLNYKSTAQIIETLTKCINLGSTYILNIGPAASGAILDIEAATLRVVGKWLRTNEKAVYGARLVAGIQCEGSDFVVENDGRWYYFVTCPVGDEKAVFWYSRKGAIGSRILRGIRRKISAIRWLDNNEEADFEQNVENEALTINCEGDPQGTHMVVRVAEIVV